MEKQEGLLENNFFWFSLDFQSRKKSRIKKKIKRLGFLQKNKRSFFLLLLNIGEATWLNTYAHSGIFNSITKVKTLSGLSGPRASREHPVLGPWD